MPSERIHDLLYRYGANRLSEAEESELFAAAMEDQEVLDQLADEDLFRDILQDPESRAIVLAALAPEAEVAHGTASAETISVDAPSLQESGASALSRITAFFQWRPAFPALAGAVALIALAIILTRSPKPGPTYGPDSVTLPGASLAPDVELSLASLAKSAIPAGSELGIDFPAGRQVRLGTDLQLSIRTVSTAAILLVETSEGQPARLLYPEQGGSPRLAAGATARLGPNSSRITGFPGKRNLLLFAFPPDSNLNAPLRGQTPFPRPLHAFSDTITVTP